MPEATEKTEINTKQVSDWPPRGIPESAVQLTTLVKGGMVYLREEARAKSLGSVDLPCLRREVDLPA